MLTYYAITNASAWTLPAEQRSWPKALSLAGIGGCVLLAFTLPVASILAGVSVLMLGAILWAVRR